MCGIIRNQQDKTNKSAAEPLSLYPCVVGFEGNLSSASGHLAATLQTANKGHWIFIVQLHEKMCKLCQKNARLVNPFPNRPASSSPGRKWRAARRPIPLSAISILLV
jgi:hypothetical protein